MAMAIPLVIEAVEGGAVAAEGATAATAAGAGESASASRMAALGARTAGKISLGSGDGGQENSIQISAADVHRILHSPDAVEAVTKKAEDLARIANGMALTRDAEYRVVVQNRDDTTRCRASVVAANYLAMVDDAHHSTLLKASAQVGSDPLP